LETANDVAELVSLLGRHRDSSGRSPCLVMNFCVANLDFPKMRTLGFKSIELLNLASGLPGRWSRSGLFEAYRQGIHQGVLYPAMHGLTHCCPVAVENALAANGDTHRAWAEAGIRVVQNGSGSGLKAPHVDEFGLLHLYRAIDVEPSQKELDTEKHLEIAAACVARGLPIVISTHAINFHSSLKDFRTSTLIALDALLKALESKYPDLLYVNDEELYTLVTDGNLRNRSQQVTVSTGAFEQRVAVMCAGTS